jgi:hypothetical protein
MGAFKIVAGWWGHQPGRPAVGGVSTAHMKHRSATILNAPAVIQRLESNNKHSTAAPPHRREKSFTSITICSSI